MINTEADRKEARSFLRTFETSITIFIDSVALSYWVS